MICLSHQNWCGFFSLVTNMNSFRRTIIIQQCRDNCVAFFVAMKQRKEKRMNNTPPMNSSTVTQHYDPEMKFKGVDKTVTTKW